MSEAPEFLTKAEIAEIARTTVSRVQYWDRRGWLPRVQPKGSRLVLHPREAVLAWLRGVELTK